MCKVLSIPRSTYYYEAAKKPDESSLVAEIREIKVELKKKDLTVSRRRIGRIMKEEGLVSSYTVAQYRPHVDKCNESKTENVVKMAFNDQPQFHVVVSDLTYVRVGMSWHYICVLVDLFNREIIGYSAGKNKNAGSVVKAFSRVDVNLEKIQIFHTDRGNEFKDQTLDETLETFHIKRSLSMKGCPYDNTEAEATFKIIKTEFVKGQVYETLEQLQYELSDYVNWFNNHRIHSSLGYKTPKEYRLTNLKKLSRKMLTIQIYTINKR